MREYTAALVLAPDAVTVRSNRAQAYLCLQDAAAALADCTFLVDMHRGNPAYGLNAKVWLRMGLAQKALGNLQVHLFVTQYTYKNA